MYIVLTMLHDSIITHDLFEFCRKGQSCSLITELCCLSRVQNSLKQHHLSWGSGWRSPSLPVVVLSYPNLYFSPGGFTSPHLSYVQSTVTWKCKLRMRLAFANFTILLLSSTALPPGCMQMELAGWGGGYKGTKYIS